MTTEIDVFVFQALPARLPDGWEPLGIERVDARGGEVFVVYASREVPPEEEHTRWREGLSARVEDAPDVAGRDV